MARIIVLLLTAALSLASFAQDTTSTSASDKQKLSAELGFEAAPFGAIPSGWSGFPQGTVSSDDKIVHGGHWSARIERNAGAANGFSTFTKLIPIEFAGSRVELRGFLRTEDVSGFAGLWMREDGESMGLAFDNMQSRQLKGTTEWTEYSITLPVVSEAKQLYIGFLVAGTGRAWADDLQLLVDGKPIWDAKKFVRAKTSLDVDHEFDNGSRITLNELTPIQIENLVTLGKVWGFLKYHHPAVTSGQQHWDYQLFRVLPSVLEARDRAAASGAILRWIDSLGAIEPSKTHPQPEGHDLHLRPNLDWIDNRSLPGAELTQRLAEIRASSGPAKQFYVAKAPSVGNPSFLHEPGYEAIKLPDAGFQLLGLYRFWNVVEYWSPYRDLIGENWDGVLKEFIPRVALANDAQKYQQELMAAIAKLHDGHANLWSSLQARPPIGNCQLPLEVRFVENRPVISGLSSIPADGAGELKIGDIITQLDDVPVEKLVESWKPYYAASNGAAQLRDIAAFMGRGACGDATIRVTRDQQEIALKVKRVPQYQRRFEHDLPGPTFRMLPDNVAYLKLSSVKAADADWYLREASRAKGLIIDIRNYPSEFVVFAVGSLLVNHDQTFARFTECDLVRPGAFRWGTTLSLTPQQPQYGGKVVVLVDEVSQSQAEYTALAFRAAGATIIGDTTAGADGNVSAFALPGGLHTMISGIGVFYPDKTATQRVGIVPDIRVSPSIAGIRAGKDEVLERAVREIVGNSMSGD